MRVPLSVESTVKRNKEYFTVWYNGIKKVIPAQINPYFYTKKKMAFPDALETKKLRMKALSNFQEQVFYKHSFLNRMQLKEARSEYSFEDNIPYIIRHRIDDPEIWKKFPHDKPLKFLFLDIEQKTGEGELFPTYDDVINSIAFCGNDRKIRCGYLKKDTASDKRLLQKFIDWWESYDPDVIVVYNKDYDIPTILERCKRNRIDTSRLTKDGTKPIVDKNGITISGVVIYDVYLSARADQSLSGNVINRGLKEVSNWFGFKEERKPLTAKEIADFTGTKELVEYNKDDIRRLLICFDVYWRNIEFNADDLGIPLSEAVDFNVSNLGLIVVGDEYRKQGIIADGSNQQRYPEIFKQKGSGGKYQGALVYLEKGGLYEPVYKIDYSSLYPTIMSEFNFSPDTTTLLSMEKYGEFKIEHEDEWDIYHIPDEVLEKNVVIQVSHKEGFASKLVKKFLNERAQYKRKWKETGDPMFRALSDNRKVKANGGVYGIQGSATHAFGYAPIAIATTGIGRECARLLINLLEELYPNSVLEVDSVTGDTPVFIKTKDTGLIDILPIEDLSDGSLRLPVKELETLTRNGWKNLNYVYNHEVEKKIYTVKGYGARIDVTEDHSLFSDGKEITPRELDFKDTIDVFPPSDFGGNQNIINEKQAWLIGFFLSDGTICKRKSNRKVFYNKDGSKRKLRETDCYDFIIAKKNIRLLEKAKDILSSDFGLDCKIYDTLDSSSCYKLEGWKKEPIKYLRSICYCKDYRTKKVPIDILNAPLNIVDAFFDGLTDGDGHIATDRKNEGKWYIDSIFKPLASGIAYLLDRKGITYNIYVREDKPHVTSIVTHKPLENCSRIVPKGYSGTVSKILYEKKKCRVYDLGTDDGTFVAGIGRVICHNTDGVYFHTKKENFNEKELLETFKQRIVDTFGKELGLSVDIDEYDKGYFYKTKNYVLKKGEKLIFHGVAMKASNKDKLVRELIRELAVATLERKPKEEKKNIVARYEALEFPLDYFAKNVRMGRRLNQYANPNALAPRMARLAEEYLNIKPQIGNQYFYVKTKTGYELFDIAKLHDIDRDYYKDEINTVADMFDIKKEAPSLSKWGI